jgi:hypothetical protein
MLDDMFRSTGRSDHVPRRFWIFSIVTALLGGTSPASSALSARTEAGEHEYIIEQAGYCEVNSVANELGFHYLETAVHAANGDIASIRRLLRFTTTRSLNSQDAMSQCATETHNTVLAKVLARVGDAKFATALARESPHMRRAILNDLDWSRPYLKKWYPRTAAAFDGKAMDSTASRSTR